MLPINVTPERMEILAATFNCQIGTMPFTYLGLPLGLAKSTASDFFPIVQRIECRLLVVLQFVTQAGKLEMVNTVLSSLPTFYASTLN